MRAYLQRHIECGRIFVGCEGDGPGLARLVQEFGPRPFVYSSDFPHEVTNATCKHELQELLDNPVLSSDAKAAILHGNAERLYRLG
jgi:predicted TIM-barrel fold metal-dependent hydrolase